MNVNANVAASDAHTIQGIHIPQMQCNAFYYQHFISSYALATGQIVRFAGTATEREKRERIKKQWNLKRERRAARERANSVT